MNMTESQLALVAKNPGLMSMMPEIGRGMAPFGGPWTPGEDVRRLISGCLTTQGQVDVEMLCKQLDVYVKSAHQAYGATLAAMMAERDSRTNNAVTLYGNSAALGATYAAGVAVPLFLRSGTGIAATPGIPLQPWMQLYRLFCGDADANAGWQFVQNSVIIGTDPAQAFNLGNVAFTSMRAVTPRLETPLAWLYDRRPVTSTTLQMSAIHFNASGIGLTEGVTATYLDTRCPDLYNWAGGYADPTTIFPLAVDKIMALVRRSFRN